MELSELSPALPEIFLACLAMLLLLLGVFRGDRASRTVSWISVLVLVITALGVIAATPDDGAKIIFAGMFVTDSFAVFVKVLVIAGSAFAIVLSIRFNEREGIARIEYPILILLATLGMIMMVSSGGLISLYMGLELQSLALYVVAAFNRDSPRSTEAGLKYFVLGALSSGLLLYGASLVYGYTGSTLFEKIAQVIEAEGVSLGLTFGLVFMCAGLAFKISAAPFHMWTPDVYEGSPTPVTFFFATAPKVAAGALFARVLFDGFGNAVAEWQQVLVFLSIASMYLGAIAAIGQSNLKRLMAYSSIGHMGFALVGLAAGTEAGAQSLLLYLAIYVVMNLGVFAFILSMERDGRPVVAIADLAGLARVRPGHALTVAVLMFSLAGLPPMVGFFATAPKVAAGGLFARVLFDGFGHAVVEWQQVLVFISIASMFLGAIAAIGQTNLKRLMAYSSIGHMGFALVGLAAGTEAGAQSLLLYLAIYVVMNLGVFAFILSMERDGSPVVTIADLSGLARVRPGHALAVAVLMFSLAGLPPMVGFFAKFFVFKAAVDAGLAPLALAGAVASVIGAYYYMNIVRVMYLTEPGQPLELRLNLLQTATIGASALIMGVGWLPFLGGLGVPDMALGAAQALMR